MSNTNFIADLEQLKKEIWYIKKTLIPNIQQQGGGNTDVSAQISSLNTRVSLLESKAAELESAISTHSTTIGTHDTDISSLKTRVTDLESNSGSSGSEEQIDELYDMRSSDATVNRGWTTGMTTARIIRTDFSKYKAIRIYASINGCDVQHVLKVAGRKTGNTSLIGFDVTNYKSLNILKVILATLNTTFQVGGWATYAYDPNNNYSLTVTKSNSQNVNYYVYRLEGIY